MERDESAASPPSRPLHPFLPSTSLCVQPPSRYLPLYPSPLRFPPPVSDGESHGAVLSVSGVLSCHLTYRNQIRITKGSSHRKHGFNVIKKNGALCIAHFLMFSHTFPKKKVNELPTMVQQITQIPDA